jgi:hypothetical protein
MEAEADKPRQVAGFRWAVGALCAFFGALMLVEPHQFSAPVYKVNQPQLQLWGADFLVAGTARLCVAAVAPRPIVSIVGHALAAAVLLLLASGFAVGGTWTAAATYSVLGLGRLTAAVVPLLGARIRGSGDLLSKPVRLPDLDVVVRRWVTLPEDIRRAA